MYPTHWVTKQLGACASNRRTSFTEANHGESWLTLSALSPSRRLLVPPSIFSPVSPDEEVQCPNSQKSASPGPPGYQGSQRLAPGPSTVVSSKECWDVCGEYHAGKNDYLSFFFLRALITEFGNNYGNFFFLTGGLFLNLVIITDQFFPQGSHFRVRKNA